MEAAALADDNNDGDEPAQIFLGESQNSIAGVISFIFLSVALHKDLIRVEKRKHGEWISQQKYFKIDFKEEKACSYSLK